MTVPIPIVDWKGVNMCRVSVILPVYNASETIDRCIESIINQTFQEWKLICCDDCSNDNSLDILRKWQNKDSRIKVLYNEKNSRAALTRNRCISEAVGEYIALIDDDDYCVLDRLEKQVEFLDEHPEYSFVGSNAFVFDENGVWETTEQKEKPQVRDFLWNNRFLNPSVMFRKNDIEKVQLYRVAKDTRRGQDYDLFMRLYAQGFSGYNMHKPLIYYYRGKKSYAKCKYEYRIDEAIIRYKNFKKLNLLPKNFLYVIKPLVLGIIPISVVKKIKK